MAWLKRDRGDERPKASQAREVPDGVWVKCEQCGEILYFKELERNLHVCPKCGYHFRIDAPRYVQILLDRDSFRETAAGVVSKDPLGFKDSKKYTDRLKEARKKTGLGEAVLTGTGAIQGIPVVLGVMDFRFIGGSMASAVGEKITRAARLALDERRPLILVTASGGARMMEGILSLMQMAKVSAALARYDEAGGLFISVLTNPTMGGVAASFASLGDLVFAEPKALIGFAGPRTIKATIRIELPKGFQTSEFLLEHGYIDRIVRRADLKSEIARAIDYCGK
jgi:acetyl-CoA carboxylase carboxyl transferase subunit beta